MSVDFHWDSGPLLRAAAESYRLGLIEAATFMRSRSRWRHVQASIHPGASGVTASSSKAKLEDGGSRPHTIEAGAKVAAFANGTFATGPIKHPGFGGNPFMQETEAAWPSIYVGAASRTFPKG